MDTHRRSRTAARTPPRFAVLPADPDRAALHLLPCPAGVVTDGLEDLGVGLVRLSDGRALPAALIGALEGDLDFTADLSPGRPVEFSLRRAQAVVRGEAHVLEAVLRRWLGLWLTARHPEAPVDDLLACVLWPRPAEGWLEPRLQRSASGSWALALLPSAGPRGASASLHHPMSPDGAEEPTERPW